VCVLCVVFEGGGRECRAPAIEVSALRASFAAWSGARFSARTKWPGLASETSGGCAGWTAPDPAVRLGCRKSVGVSIVARAVQLG